MMDERMIHLDKFITDISSYSRNARVDLDLKFVPLKKIVRECIGGLMYAPEAEKTKVNMNIQDDLTILSDQTRLEIIVGNIISNAFKYQDRTKANPTIEISAILLPSSVEITIADNGIGIPNEYISKIFDMFFQAHDRAKGSGLGLYIVKETLEKLNGSITVNTEIEKGSTFTISLPSHYSLNS
jgi:signal transduction histidine kinase